MTMTNPFVVMREVEKYYHLKRGVLIQRDRQKTVARARAVAMYLVRDICEMSYPEIGDYFERDHSTIINACAKIKMLFLFDPFSTTLEGVKQITKAIKENV